jgi:hypothetical protein
LLTEGSNYLPRQKINVKQFKDGRSFGAAEGVGIKRQKFLFQRRHSTIYILLLAEEAP